MATRTLTLDVDTIGTILGALFDQLDGLRESRKYLPEGDEEWAVVERRDSVEAIDRTVEAITALEPA